MGLLGQFFISKLTQAPGSTQELYHICILGAGIKVLSETKGPITGVEKATDHETDCCPPESACGTAHDSFSPSSSNSLSGDSWHSIKTKLPCQGKQNETKNEESGSHMPTLAA